MSDSIDKPGTIGVSIKDATKQYGGGRSKLYDAMNSGDLPAHKLGTRTIILVDDLKAYVRGLPTYRQNKCTVTRKKRRSS